VERPISATAIAAALLGDYATAGRAGAAGASTDADARVGDVRGGSPVDVVDVD
jgi:hypothetical protein